MYKNTVVLASAPQRKKKRTEERHKLWGEECEKKSKIQNREKRMSDKEECVIEERDSSFTRAAALNLFKFQV